MQREGQIRSTGVSVPGSSGEVLAGTIERVTFHNVENGFCVLRVKARGRRDLITVVGHAASISAGERVTATGEWVNDRTHEPQFRARFLRASAPTTAEGIEKYLASGMIRGIGPGYAKRRAVSSIRPLRAERICAACCAWVRLADVI
jgi:exodeoxyribonuclease V alpha subunit